MLKEEVFTIFRGMNRISDRLNMSPEFLYDLLNGYIKKDVKTGLGVIVQRDGLTKFNSTTISTVDYGTSTKIKTVYEAKWNTGSTDIIIRAGTAWGKFVTNAFTTVDGARTDDVFGQCAMFKNELIMVDGGIPRKMVAAGTVDNLSADADMPQDSTAVWVHKDKVWLNSAAAPMTACFCTTNSANGAASWSGATDAGTIDLSTVLPTGDTIIGFRSYGGSNSNLIAIICKKYTAIYEAGANVYTFTLMQVLPTTCVSMNACDYVGPDLVYPSQNGLTSIFSSAKNELLETAALSKYIEPLYRDLLNNVTTVANITGAFNYKLNHYYITFPVTNNFQTLVYSVDVGNFVGRWTHAQKIYGYCERRSGVMLVGSDDFVYTFNSGTTDSATAISFKVAMPALYFKEPSRYKRPIEFEALIQNDGNLTLYLDYWYGLSTLASDKVTKTISVTGSASMWDTAVWDVDYWDMQGNTIFRTSDLLGRGRMMFVELRHSTSGAKITIPWFGIGYAVEGGN